MTRYQQHEPLEPCAQWGQSQMVRAATEGWLAARLQYVWGSHEEHHASRQTDHHPTAHPLTVVGQEEVKEEQRYKLGSLQ